MSRSFTWEEWEEYKAGETFNNIKFDILLEKDQDEVLKLVREHLEHRQRKIVTKFDTIDNAKSVFESRQVFENNIRPRTGKTNHWLDNALTKIAIQGEDSSWTVVYHPDLMWADALMPSSEELERMMKGQLYGLSMDAVYFDESSVLNNPEEDKPKKKKNMRDDIRSFLNKGRKW